MRKITSGVILFLMVLFIFLQGCATTPDKPFVRKDIASLSPLKVIRYNEPEILKTTLGRAVVGGLLLGGLGASIATIQGGKELKEKYALPDLGQLVMNNFVERIREEIPNWPEQITEEEPFGKGYTYLGTVLEFIPFFIQVADHGLCKGICAYTDVRLKDSVGSVLWQARFTYRSKSFGRGHRSLTEFEADNGKLLKEEMKFASEVTVSYFIKHFKGEK